MIKLFRDILTFCKEALALEQSPIKAIVSVLFVLTGSLFFYKQLYASLFPGIMMIVWLLIKDPPRSFFRNYFKSGLWLFLLVFVMYAVSMIYSDNKELSRTILETKLLLPILPLLLVKQWKPSRKLVHMMFIVLTISFIVMLTSLWISMYYKYAAGHADHWRFQHSWYLNRKYGLHHGDYAIIGLLISVYFAVRLYQGRSRPLLWIPLVLFWTLIFVTGSDIIKFISGIIIITFIVDFAWKGFRKAFPYLYIISIAIILIFSFTLSGNGRLQKSSNDRLFIWPASVELIKEKPLFGHGLGDVHKSLIEKYQKIGYDKPLNLKNNSHNQFLDITLASGFLGLAALVTMLISAAFLISRKNSLYGIHFMLAITMSLSVENLLSRLDGIIIVCFFFVASVSLPREESSSIHQNNIKSQ